MKTSTPIKVECYSGYKADEYPKCFYWDDERFEIKEVLDRWFQGDQNPDWPVADYFKVCTTCGRQYIIKHEIKSDVWYLVSQDEHKTP